MELKELIGKRLVAVQGPWEGEFDEGEMRLTFEGGVIVTLSADTGNWHTSAGIEIEIEVAD